MKKASILLLLGLMLAFCLPMAAKAALTDNGDGTVTDGNGIMWLQVPAEDLMTYDEAVAWADALVFAGYDDWRLPSAINSLTGVPDTSWNNPNTEWGYLYITEWDNPWGKAGGYSLPPGMATMPEYWDYAQYWWTETEYDVNSAWAFWASWDMICNHDTRSKTDLLAVTAVRDSTVIPPEKLPPVASFTASPSTAPVGTTIDFNAGSSDDPDGIIMTYAWDFGDGTGDSGETASHAYSADNIYTVTLTVTDNDGLTDTATAEITVYIEVAPVIPEVPLGTIVISASMIIALGAYFALPRLRRKSEYIKP